MFWSWFKRTPKVTRAPDENAAPNITDWPATLRGMSIFRDLSDDAITELCARVETVPVKKGAVIIREGEEADYFYAVVQGKASVTRRAESPTRPAPAAAANRVALLTPGTGFGEEALISCRKRNATVTMIEDGLLMRLSRERFDELLKKPRLRWVSGREAAVEVSRGAQWLDVRTEEEHLWRSLFGSICIPLQNIRADAAKLDKSKLYICYCETGRLSATAAFLLAQMGHQVAVLRGGLRAQ